MTYNSLPYEVKQLITKLVRQGDLNYAGRIKVEQGKAKELCWKYLFGTLRASKATKDTFQYGILEGPAANAVTTLVLDETSLEGVTFTLFHNAPRLHNLAKVVIKSINTYKSQWRTEPERREAAQRVNRQLLKLASSKSITSWDFRGFDNPELTYKLLIGGKPQIVDTYSARIRSLAFSETEISFFSIVAPLPSLAHLTLEFEHGSEPYCPTDHPPWFTTTSLLYNYSFRDRLSSLSISIMPGPSRQWPLDITVLEFAALFPSLLRLDLAADDAFYDETESHNPIRLPVLSNLRLQLPTFLAIHSTLDRLDLPVLETLSLDLLDTEEPSEELLDDLRDHDALVKRISSMEGTLRLLRLTCRNLYRRDETLGLQDALHELPIQIIRDCLVSDEHSETFDPPLRPTSVTENDDILQLQAFYERECKQCISEQAPKLGEMAEWIQKRTEVLAQEIGVEEFVEIMKVMKPLEDHKRWLQD
ncbi:uncharacterized protein JCM6883_006578 [Sporobolomyces salmoneus]|uniref:uncharacterized protein n=1 Tax=Sporobolomyces salmoneus TaxID=183962 RepID=UPI003178E40B